MLCQRKTGNPHHEAQWGQQRQAHDPCRERVKQRHRQRLLGGQAQSLQHPLRLCSAHTGQQAPEEHPPLLPLKHVHRGASEHCPKDEVGGCQQRKALSGLPCLADARGCWGSVLQWQRQQQRCPPREGLRQRREFVASRGALQQRGRGRGLLDVLKA